MSTAARLLIAVVAFVVLAFAVAVGATTAAVYRHGSVRVEVEPANGGEIRVSVPAGLANLAIAVMPDEVLSEVSDELAPYFETLRVAGRELSGLPDFTLLEVRSRDERVIIRKVGRKLVIHVESSNERVHVEVPIRTVERVATRLAGRRFSI